MKKYDLLCLLPLWLLTSCGSRIVSSPSLTGTSSKYSVQLTWQEPVSSDPAVSYNVYREPETDAVYAQINPSPVVTPGYTDSNVRLGASYTYVVRAVDAAGQESPLSNRATVTVPSN